MLLKFGFKFIREKDIINGMMLVCVLNDSRCVELYEIYLVGSCKNALIY